jgi:hypothetical protein
LDITCRQARANKFVDYEMHEAASRPAQALLTRSHSVHILLVLLKCISIVRVLDCSRHGAGEEEEGLVMEL